MVLIQPIRCLSIGMKDGQKVGPIIENESYVELSSSDINKETLSSESEGMRLGARWCLCHPYSLITLEIYTGLGNDVLATDRYFLNSTL